MDGVSVWLDVAFEDLIARMPQDGRRPLAADRAAMERLFAMRVAGYSAARLRVDAAARPEEVAEQILEFRDEVGAFGTLLYTGHDWADPALARRSMELTANEVLPNIHRAIRGRARKV